MDRPAETEIGACGSCMRALRWVRSWDTGETYALVADDTRRDVFHLHRCWPLQAPATWRSLDHGDPPSAAYLAAKQALKSKERTDNEGATP